METFYETRCSTCRELFALSKPEYREGKTFICPICESKKNKENKIFYVSYAPLSGRSWNISEFARPTSRILENLNVVFRYIHVSGYDGHSFYYVFVEDVSKSAALEKAEQLIYNFDDEDPQSVKVESKQGLSPEEALIFDKLGRRYDDWMNDFSLPARNHIISNKEIRAVFYALSKFIADLEK